MSKPVPGAGLAERFRKAVATEEETKRLAAEAAKQAEAEARRGQDQLLADLASFGRALGFLRVTPSADALDLSREGRTVRFVRSPPGALSVSWPDEGQAMIYREVQLGDRWVLVVPRRGRDQRLPLFDQGLEELLVVALGLPRPE